MTSRLRVHYCGCPPLVRYCIAALRRRGVELHYITLHCIALQNNVSQP